MTDKFAVAADFATRAAESRAQAVESFERCDTDGALSQYAHGLSARKYDLEAELAANDGLWEFPALFNLEGDLVPAKLVTTRYGVSWGLLDPTDVNASFVGFFNPSKAASEGVRVANNARKGYFVGVVKAEAAVGYSGGSGRGLSGLVGVAPVLYRKDRGFSTDVTVVTSAA